MIESGLRMQMISVLKSFSCSTPANIEDCGLLVAAILERHPQILSESVIATFPEVHGQHVPDEMGQAFLRGFCIAAEAQRTHVLAGITHPRLILLSLLHACSPSHKMRTVACQLFRVLMDENSPLYLRLPADVPGLVPHRSFEFSEMLAMRCSQGLAKAHAFLAEAVICEAQFLFPHVSLLNQVNLIKLLMPWASTVVLFTKARVSPPTQSYIPSPRADAELPWHIVKSLFELSRLAHSRTTPVRQQLCGLWQALLGQPSGFDPNMYISTTDCNVALSLVTQCLAHEYFGARDSGASSRFNFEILPIDANHDIVMADGQIVSRAIFVYITRSQMALQAIDMLLLRLPFADAQCPQVVGEYLQWVGKRCEAPADEALSSEQKMAIDMLLPVCMERRDLVLPYVPRLLHLVIVTDYRPRYASTRVSLIDFLCDTMLLPFARDAASFKEVDLLRELSSSSMTYAVLWSVPVLKKLFSALGEITPGILTELRHFAFSSMYQSRDAVAIVESISILQCIHATVDSKLLFQLAILGAALSSQGSDYFVVADKILQVLADTSRATCAAADARSLMTAVAVSYMHSPAVPHMQGAVRAIQHLLDQQTDDSLQPYEIFKVGEKLWSASGDARIDIQIVSVLRKGLAHASTLEPIRWMFETMSATYAHHFPDGKNQLLFTVTFVHMCRVISSRPSALDCAEHFFQHSLLRPEVVDSLIGEFRMFRQRCANSDATPEIQRRFVASIFGSDALELVGSEQLQCAVDTCVLVLQCGPPGWCVIAALVIEALVTASAVGTLGQSRVETLTSVVASLRLSTSSDVGAVLAMSPLMDVLARSGFECSGARSYTPACDRSHAFDNDLSPTIFSAVADPAAVRLAMGSVSHMLHRIIAPWLTDPIIELGRQTMTVPVSKQTEPSRSPFDTPQRPLPPHTPSWNMNLASATPLGPEDYPTPSRAKTLPAKPAPALGTPAQKEEHIDAPASFSPQTPQVLYSVEEFKKRLKQAGSLEALRKDDPLFVDNVKRQLQSPKKR